MYKQSSTLASKIISSIVIAFLTICTAQAQQQQQQQQQFQKEWRLGVGFNVGGPTGYAVVPSNSVIGGDIRLQYGVSQIIAIMVTGGYDYYHGKKIYTDYRFDSFAIIPVKAGAKAILPYNIYVSGEAGAGFETGIFGTTRLIMSPGIGYASKIGIDVSVHYDSFVGHVNNYGVVAFRLAYGVKL